jgi:hypothetical protein
MKNKKCLKCGIQIHYTDWIILKELSLLPVCDNCLLKEDERDEIKEKQLFPSINKKIRLI